MSIKIGINGFGRMGRLAMRALFDHEEIEIVQVNDPAGDAATMAHLVTFDSIHGRWHHEAGIPPRSKFVFMRDGQRVG